MENNNYSNPYSNNAYEDVEIDQNKVEQIKVEKNKVPPTQQPTPPPENDEQIQIKIDRKGKGHAKEQSVNYGFIGSTSSNKYSNPYDNNVYGDFPSTSKKEKRNSKKPNKKRSSTEQLPADIDVTQAPLNGTVAAVGAPVVYYTTPTVGTPVATATVPTVYYTTPVATPVAIQYVNSPTIAGSTSSQSELNKEKRESRKYTSYFGDKENAEEDIIKSNDKEKEYQEIMNELGMKPKEDKPKDLKSRFLRHQLTILISALIIFVLLIVLYFVWPRVPDITVKEFALQEENGIQYKFPMNIEYREEYTDLNNVTSSDVDSFMRFNLITHFDVKNNNFLPYKFHSLNLDVSFWKKKKKENKYYNILIIDTFIICILISLILLLIYYQYIYIYIYINFIYSTF